MRYVLILVVALALIPGCQREAQQAGAKPATRTAETRPAWNGARPLDWEYTAPVIAYAPDGKHVAAAFRTDDFTTIWPVPDAK